MWHTLICHDAGNDGTGYYGHNAGYNDGYRPNPGVNINTGGYNIGPYGVSRDLGYGSYRGANPINPGPEHPRSWNPLSPVGVNSGYSGGSTESGVNINTGGYNIGPYGVSRNLGYGNYRSPGPIGPVPIRNVNPLPEIRTISWSSISPVGTNTGYGGGGGGVNINTGGYNIGPYSVSRNLGYGYRSPRPINPNPGIWSSISPAGANTGYGRGGGGGANINTGGYNIGPYGISRNLGYGNYRSPRPINPNPEPHIISWSSISPVGANTGYSGGGGGGVNINTGGYNIGPYGVSRNLGYGSHSDDVSHPGPRTWSSILPSGKKN